MPLRITPLHPHVGAEISGIDLAAPVSQAQVEEIEHAINRHAVLVFRNQRLTDAQQLSFSRNFGPLEISPNYVAGVKPRLPDPQLIDISNIGPDGRVLPPGDRRREYDLGNQLWHTDSSFKHVPAKLSLLMAQEVPPAGGETEFTDMRAAYDALPEERKRLITDLVVEHSIFRSRSQIGFTEFDPTLHEKLPPVRQTMVRRHPGSGRMSLYLASHASHVIGWPVEKGRALIEELIAFATQPQFVFRHEWRVDDLVMWDNRCTMHRGRPYDPAHRRVMQRTTVADIANTLDQAAAWSATPARVTGEARESP
ncbi:MAG: TauD/TfdA family dioxygenase [Alphaproteobacteria bacterium]